MVERWDIITIGNLSRNRYWGEPEDTARRGALCTCTLVRGPGYCLLVDPSVADREVMASELNRRTGLALDDVTHTFITHGHGDHWYGLNHFARAAWFAVPEVADELNASGRLAHEVGSASGELVGGVHIIATPGHTHSHHSLLFTCDGLRVVIAGDAVMTRDFWRDRAGYHNSVSAELVAATIDDLAARVDAVVPGHDNWFLSRI